MWFPLARDYETGPDDTHRLSWRIGKIKQGVPIYIRFTFLTGEILPEPVFVYDSFQLHGLTLEDFSLPEDCCKDERGNVFCAKDRTFFVPQPFWIEGAEIVAAQIEYCPKCGQKVVDLPPIPEEETRQYEVTIGKASAAA